jgi:isoleucyl-tRNA synthetase
MLAKKLTPELRNEGLARDIIRNIQKLRKDANLDIADRIKLRLETSSNVIREAIDSFGDYIKQETLAVELVASPLDGKTTEADVKLDGEPLRITLAVA